MGDRLASKQVSKYLFGHNRHGPKSGGMCPYLGGPRSPSNTMSPTSLPSDILIHPAVWPQQTWAKNWEGAVPLWKLELGPHLTQCGQGRGLGYLHAKFHLDPSNPLATIHQRYRQDR